jgi:hypothetical protein
VGAQEGKQEGTTNQTNGAGFLPGDPSDRGYAGKECNRKPAISSDASKALVVLCTVADKSRIIYSSHMTLSEIPLEAYDYVVNGKPAIEWIMERYQFTRDKDSGIVNDDEGRFSDRQDLSE